MRVFLVGLLMLVISSAKAQTNVDAGNRSLLWRISGNHLSKPSYLFGTIHAICDDDYLWTAKMKDCLSNSDKVCFETDISDTLSMIKLTMAMVDTTGKKLSDYFTAVDYATVQRYFKDNFHKDIAGLQEMKPMVLLWLMLKKLTPCPHPLSYERRIMKTIATDNKEIMGLETAEDQIKLMDAITPGILVKAINEQAYNNRKMSDVYQQMVVAYKRQDAPLLYSLGKQGQSIDLMAAILDERNEKWVNIMPAKMEQSSVFFAVGACHLWGEMGVINLLIKAGYTVTPLLDTINITERSSENVPSALDRIPAPAYSLRQYLIDNLHYPAEAKKNNITGQVTVTFIVNEDGAISNCKVNSGIGYGCDEEALRVIKEMPSWKPGVKDGKPRKAYMTQPISFMLPADDKNTSEDTPSVLDEMPTPGYSLRQYLVENLHYPPEAKKNNITGRVTVSFVVNKDGTISNCKVNGGIGYGCDEEALRVIKEMPSWKPGMKDGRPRKVNMTQPVRFRFSSAEDDKNKK